MDTIGSGARGVSLFARTGLSEKDVVYRRTYKALDYAFDITTNVPEVQALFEPLFEPFESTEASGSEFSYVMELLPDGQFALYVGTERVLNGSRSYPGSMVQYVISHVNREVIRTASAHLLVHASAASYQGIGVVLPAAMDSGKTTTVAGLVAAGFDYITDEAVVVDPLDGLIHPYPRPLAMDRSSVDLIEGLSGKLSPIMRREMQRLQFHVPAKDIRSASKSAPSPVGFVVAPSYSSGARTQLTPISRAEGVMTLAQNSFNFDAFGARGLDLLASVVHGARCYRLTIGDLGEAVGLIKNLFDRSA